MNAANRSNARNRGSTSNHSKPNAASEIRSVGLFILISAIRLRCSRGSKVYPSDAIIPARRLFNLFQLGGGTPASSPFTKQRDSERNA